MSKLQPDQVNIPQLVDLNLAAGGMDLQKILRWNGTAWAAAFDQLATTGPISAPLYTVLDTDRVITTDSSFGTVQLNLPASPRSGHVLMVVDGANAAAVNDVVVNGNGFNISGAATRSITAGYGALVLAFNGAQWVVQAEVGAAAGWTVVDLNVVGSGHTLSNADSVVTADPSGGGMTVFLPSSGLRDGQLVYLFNRSTSTNTLTLNGNGFNIDGAATKVLSTSRGAVLVCFSMGNGTWTILSEKGAATPNPWTKVDLNIVGTGYTITNDDTIVEADTSGGAMQVFLPASGLRNGQLVFVYKRTTSTNNLTVEGNGTNINGAATKVLSASRQGVLVVYSSSAAVWTILAEINAPTSPTAVTMVTGVSNYAATNTDQKIAVDTGTFSVTIDLPTSPANGQQHTIWDATGSAGTRNITVQGAHQINGAGTMVLNVNRQARTVTYNGSTFEWEITAGYL